jgi:DNA-binding NarL/FixJ family response regulator
VPAKNVRGWQADEDRLVPKLVVAAPVPDLSVRARRIGVAIAVWRCQDGLTSAETEVLLLATEGLTVLQIAEARGTTVETALTQSKALLRKTLDDSLPFAALRLLGEAASLP